MNEKTRPLVRDSAIAISLNQIAEQKALSYYSEGYIEERFDIPSSECIIPNKIFLKILNDCIILSQQKIEERLISTKLLFPNKKDGFPQGVKFIPIEEFSFPSIDLTNLKKYLEMAGDANTFLVIDFFENEEDDRRFSLKGFMFIEKSLRSFVIKYKQEKFSMKYQKSSELLGCLFNSVIFSVDFGRVSVSYFDKTFLIIEKGIISPISYFDIEIFLISSFSSEFQDKLKDFLGDDFKDLSLKKLINKLYVEDIDELTQKKIIIQALINYRILESLRNIFLKISEARHGSTLIFNFEGDINDNNLFQPGAIKLEIPYGSTLLKLTELDNPNSFFSEENQEIFNCIEMYENAIVSLSKTDGAMIFNQKLDLILVGAFLKTKSSASLSGGARRKSAEGFIMDNKGTMAIVISQDGTVTYLPEIVIGDSQ